MNPRCKGGRKARGSNHPLSDAVGRDCVQILELYKKLIWAIRGRGNCLELLAEIRGYFITHAVLGVAWHATSPRYGEQHHFLGRGAYVSLLRTLYSLIYAVRFK